MDLEVELKFPVAEPGQIANALAALGCRFSEPLDQADLYFAHPARDFAQTDEALRLRRSGDEACITYKGPKLDAATKTRREIELPIAGGSEGYARYRELLEALGFRAVLEVRKRRTQGTIDWEGTEIEVALDDVVGLGAFVELELLAPAEQLASAKEKLLSLAARLDLSGAERRGYLDLLLEK